MNGNSYRYIKYKKFTDNDCEISSKVVFVHKRDSVRSCGHHTIHSATVSVQRAHKSLFDLLRCNRWQYFITLTFGDPERVSDQYCRDQFALWRKEMRRKYPSMYYVAVPEYHQLGSLHYHVVIGGISSVDLGLVDSGRVLHNGKAWLRTDFDSNGFSYNLDVGEGATVWNVGGWTIGYSTATEIRSTGAVSLYVSKYLTKNNIDPRFINKRRYYSSHNCSRPQVLTDVFPVSYGSCTDTLSEFSEKCFSFPKYYYDKYDCAEDVVKARLQGLVPVPKRELPF